MITVTFMPSLDGLPRSYVMNCLKKAYPDVDGEIRIHRSHNEKNGFFVTLGGPPLHYFPLLKENGEKL